jgi:anti-anti-sigma regulatory factor
MAGHPLSALCGFRTDLGVDTLAEFVSLHEAGPTCEPASRVFGCPDGTMGLAGQFDPVTVAALERVLARLRAGVDDGALVVDIADVEYVDHRLLLALSDYARRNGVEVSVRAIPPFATRLMDLMPASYLRLAEVGARS